MKNGIIGFFSGKVKLGTDAFHREKFIGFLMENGIRATVIPEPDGGISVIIPARTAKKIASALDKSGIIVYIINIYGLMRILSSYGRRYGLLSGAAVFTLLLAVSSLFVWKVDVRGTELLSKEQIRAELSEMGVRPGVKISGIDKSAVSDRFLSVHPELSWASLGFSGTTATLTLRETVSREAEGNEALPKILVASEDALVKRVEVYDGKPTVKPGSAVKKGDVLITGYISGSGLQYSESPALRVTGAAGSVTTETEKTISVFVPRSEDVKRTEKDGNAGYTVSVFGRTFFFGNTESAPESERFLTVFGRIELPITVKNHPGYSESRDVITRTPEEARSEAEKRLFSAVYAETGNGELTYTEITFSEDGNGCTATAVFGYEKNIAVPYIGEK